MTALPSKNGIESDFPWPIVIVAAIGYFVDLFDTFLVPALRVVSLRDLGIPDSESFAVYTTVMNAQLFGMVIGAFFLWGPIADKIGRRKVLLASILVYTVANFITAAVQDATTYAFIRFIAGIGLGGELGAGVTLVAETMAEKKRSLGPAIIGFCGMLGVVAAALLAKSGLDWRTIYIIGGFLGIGVFLLRTGVRESPLFEANLQNKSTAKYWDVLRFLFSWKHSERRKYPPLLIYIGCVLVGAPTFFVTGLLVPGAPEFGREFGMSELPTPANALIFTYVSIAIGDILCGWLSHKIQSRKYALLTFHIIAAIGIASFVVTPPIDPQGFYLRCIVAGLGIGFWANMVLNAAEQFGTNVRATVTITVPNLVRFLLFPISTAYLTLKPMLGILPAAAIIGGCCSLLAITATLLLRDGAKENLDYNEQI